MHNTKVDYVGGESMTHSKQTCKGMDTLFVWEWIIVGGKN